MSFLQVLRASADISASISGCSIRAGSSAAASSVGVGAQSSACAINDGQSLKTVSSAAFSRPRVSFGDERD